MASQRTVKMLQLCNPKKPSHISNSVTTEMTLGMDRTRACRRRLFANTDQADCKVASWLLQNKQMGDESDVEPFPESEPEYVPNMDEESTDTSTDADIQNINTQKCDNRNLTLSPTNIDMDENLVDCNIIQVDSGNNYLENSNIIENTELQRKCKRQACFYCKKLVAKIARHLENVHSTEVAVSQFLSLPKRDKLRLKLIDDLKKKGNFNHNCCILRNGGTLILERQSKVAKAINLYLPCTECLGFFDKSYLRLHYSKCSRDKKNNTMSRITSLSAILLPLPDYIPVILKEKVFSRMSVDDISKCAQTDETIVTYGSIILNRFTNKDRMVNYVSQKMRELARLLLVLQRKDNEIHKLKDAIHPKKFHLILESAKEISGYNAVNSTFSIPSLAKKIGHSLHICADILLSAALCEDRKIDQENYTNFKKLYKIEWKIQITNHALKTLEEVHWNEPQLIPLTEDIKKITEFLNKEETSLYESLKEKFYYAIWNKLGKVILAKLIIFNRRRSGETEAMFVQNFDSRHTITHDTDIYNSLSQIEKIISEHYLRVEVRGKKGRRVPILIHNKTVYSIELFLKLRSLANVSMENPYVFGRKEGSVLRGSDVIRQFAIECKAEKPEYLTSTKLRKHIAIVSQILSLKENEMDELAKYLGHDIRVHREFYRLPDETIQIAKMSKLLIAVERGDVNKYKNKSLEELHVDYLSSDGDNESHNSDELIEPVSDVTNACAEDTIDMTSAIQKNQPDDRNGEPGNKNKVHTSNRNRICNKQSWTTPEKSAVYKNLAMYFAKKKVPGKEVIEEAMRNNKCLQGRTWRQIKYYVYNYVKKKSH